MRYLTLDTNIPPIYAKSIDEFNDYVEKYQTENEIILTKGGNISQKNLRNLPCSKTWKRASHFEFQYIDGKQQIRVLYAPRYEEDKADPTIAMKALNYFKGILDVIPDDDHEKDSELFTCPENPFSKYYNYVNDRYIGFTIDNCYSLDRNSAFLASMLEIYPQTKPWVDKYYQDKLAGNMDVKPYDKIIVGWLKNPSKHRLYAWKKIISNSNKLIHDLRKKIEANGNTVLLVNTDAIKFIGEFPYDVNKDLGGFKYEWQNTKMYIKGVKSYAYLDGDKWRFKQAGNCKLDSIKCRDEWTLEDFKEKDTLAVLKVKIKKGTNYIEEYYG